jgi:hypothetical protein
MKARRFGIAVICSWLTACAEPLPEPPDLTETIEAYERGPTVDVPLAELADAIVAWLDRRGLREELVGSGLVFDVIRTGAGLPEPERPGIDPEANPREAVQILEGRFTADLFVEVTRICQGHDPSTTTPNRDTNGELRVKSRLTESGFDGTFWGEFSQCRFRSDDVDLGFDFNTLTIDGEAALLLLDPRGFDIERDYLFVFEGIGILNGITLVDGQLDFLVRRDEGTEVRIADETGAQFFFFVPFDNPNAFELRTLSETWECDIALRRCLSTDGTRISW